MIYLTQWLCPKRHCSIALAWDDQDNSEDTVVKEGEALYQGSFNRWCGLCGSRQLTPEHGRTPFSTVEEATTAMAPMEEANTRARRLWRMF